jgi:tRNA(fMet)-specific endonuclease VapC
MEVVLDTNAYSDWVRKGLWQNSIARADRVWIPTVVIGELYRGFFSGNRFSVNEAYLREVLEQPTVGIIEVDFDGARIYGELLHYLRKGGNTIPSNDVWIAAACIQRGGTLLTSDKHFESLPQVRVARRVD